MAISDKTRKMLWAKSGNKCALCFHELVMIVEGNNTIIGIECHIVSEHKNGPRHRAMNGNDYDNYGNLILLCPTHHKLIDDNVKKYSEDVLIKIKKDHEYKIALLTEPPKKLKVNLLFKCEHTRDLVRCLFGAEAFATDYPIECKKDYDLFSEFFDWVNNSDVLEDLDEFARISYFDSIFDRIHAAGYVILIGNESQYGKYKLNTSFVFIRTKEDYEKNKLSF